MTANSQPMPNIPLDRSSPPGPGPRRPFSFPDIERSQLPNGLPVLMARTEGPPVATIALLLPAAGLHEPEERAGLASLTGTLLDSGTERRSAPEIAEAFEGFGAQYGVGTTWDVTEVGLTALTTRLEPASQLVAELVRQPSFPLNEVERVREEQIAAIIQRRADPRGLANEAATRFIFADDTPYSRPLSGTRTTLSGLTREDITAFHADQYTPFGATILIAGNLDPDLAHDLVAQIYGDWVGPVAQRGIAEVRPASRSRRVVIVDRPGAVQSEIRAGHIGVPRSTPDYFPLMVMNAILGGAFTSRLNLNLRERQGFTYGVTSHFTMRRQAGPFAVSTAVQTEVTAAALREIIREIDGIRDSAVTQAELEDARNYLAGVFPLRLDTTEGVTSRLAELALHDLPLDYFDSYRDRILDVSSDEVLRVAQEHIRPEELCVVVVGDAGKIRSDVEALALGPVEVVDVGVLP